jgi:hypothetical protein
MYDTPLTRPTTVGGLLGNVFRGTGQVAQAGGGVPLQNYLLGPRALDMLAARRLSTPATTTIAPSPVGLLSPEMMSTQAPVGFDYISPAPQLPQLQPNSSEQPMVSPANQIERNSVPPSSSGLLGSVGRGLSGAASELGGLFSGEEGQARARALSKSLLSGPSATPISFGQKIAEGLMGGQDEIEAQEKRKYLKEQMQEKRSESKARKEFKEAVEGGDENKVNKAFKKAYPLEWAKSNAKNQSVSDLKADAIKEVARADKNKTPRSELPKYIIDLYNAATSSGSADVEAVIAKVLGNSAAKPSTEPTPQENGRTFPAGTVVKSGGIEYEVQGDGTVKPINR